MTLKLANRYQMKSIIYKDTFEGIDEAIKILREERLVHLHKKAIDPETPVEELAHIGKNGLCERMDDVIINRIRKRIIGEK